MGKSQRWRASAEALGDQAGQRAPVPYAVGFRHGTLEVGYYTPAGEDRQSPHDRDEVYVVTRGRGTFVRGEERVPFGPGDALFVPAGLEHRFEDFGDELETWVMFYGPSGGEADA